MWRLPTATYLRCGVCKEKFFTLFVFFILLILWACYAHYFNPPIFPLDDGYIYLHNAQVLHLGYDRNYLGVPALAGSTSPIYLLLVSLLLYVLSPLWALQTAAWLGILIYSLGLVRLTFVHRASAIQALLFLISGLGIAFTPYQLLNGVETGWAMAAVVWTLALMSAGQTLRCRILISVLCGTLPFLRPELIIFSAWIMVWQTWRYGRNILFDLFVMLICAAPWIIWCEWSMGQFYPMTINAKAIFTAQSCLLWHEKTHYFLLSFFSFIKLIGEIVFFGMLILLSVTALGRVILVALLSFFILFWFYMPEVVVFNNLRYLYPLIPLLLYGVFSCIQNERTEIYWAANFLLLLTAACAIAFFPLKWRTYVADARLMTSSLVAVAQWCNTNLPSHSTLLVHDAGYISVATSFHLIDLVGLKTPACMAYQQQYTLDGCKMQRGAATAAIIQHYHPDYLIVLPDWMRGFGIMRNATQLGWSAKLLYETGPGGYRVYKVNVLN
jgi:hypothetical protein